METLFGLSIRQPWLDMIVRGHKSIEVRQWEVKRRGLVALHAPWQIDFNAAYFYGYENPHQMPRGHIVALAQIVDAFAFDATSWHHLLEQHRQPMPLVEGSFGVVLKQVETLEEPVRCRGRQMFFPLPTTVALKVRELMSS